MIELVKTIIQVIAGFFIPIFKTFFMSETVMKYGIYAFIGLIVFGGMMTKKQKKKALGVSSLLAGIIGTIVTLVTHSK